MKHFDEHFDQPDSFLLFLHPPSSNILPSHSVAVLIHSCGAHEMQCQHPGLFSVSPHVSNQDVCMAFMKAANTAVCVCVFVRVCVSSCVCMCV